MTAVGARLNPGMMSSLRSDWATPDSLFQMLDNEFHFALDVCADPRTAKTPRWFSVGENGLTKEWDAIAIGRSIWCNPPYGRVIGYWIEKAYRESRLGATVVLLLPSRTDTQWWHDYCMKGEIRFLRGRLSFDNQRRGRAPFPSAIVIFRPASSSAAQSPDGQTEGGGLDVLASSEGLPTDAGSVQGGRD